MLRKIMLMPIGGSAMRASASPTPRRMTELALLVHGAVLVIEAEAVDERPELDDECGHRQGKKDETLKARDVFHGLSLAISRFRGSSGPEIHGNCPPASHGFHSGARRPEAAVPGPCWRFAVPRSVRAVVAPAQRIPVVRMSAHTAMPMTTASSIGTRRIAASTPAPTPMRRAGSAMSVPSKTAVVAKTGR